MAFMNRMRDNMAMVFAIMAGIFLLMIIFEWGGQGTLFQKNTDQTALGNVNGQKISVDDYNKTVTYITDQQKEQNKKADLTEGELETVRDNAWDQLVGQALVKASMQKLGITVTDQEIRDRVFNNPPDMLRRGFVDSTGVFHQDEFIKALRDPRNDSLIRYAVEPMIREQVLQEKWMTVMNAIPQVTESELWDRYYNNAAKASVEVIKILPKGNPAEFAKQVSDKEIQDYYNAHQAQYKSEESRKVKFVIFQQLPTSRDSAVARDRVQNLKRRLGLIPTTASPMELDSIAKDLAQDYTEQPVNGARPINPAELGSEPIENVNVGSVLTLESPMGLAVARITSATDTGAEFYNSSHILVGFGKPENRDSAKALADKIYAEIQAGGDFAALAKKYSSDPMSARNGGSIGWTDGKNLVPEYNNVAKSAPLNVAQPPVASQFGYHIIKTTGHTKRKVAGIVIPIDIKPSSQTTQMIKQQAQVFREQAAKSGFDAAAKSAGYRVLSDAPPITRKGQAIFGSKPFVDWAMSAEKDEISQPIRAPQARLIVVAQLTEIKPAGTTPLAEVQDEIRRELGRRKLVASVAPQAKQIHDAVAASGDMNAAAAQDSSYKPLNLQMGPAESVAGLNTEYAVNTAAYRMKPGEISQPIKGDNGYYVVKLGGIAAPTKQGFEAQKESLRQTILREKQQRFLSQWVEKEKENAKIEDFRDKR